MILGLAYYLFNHWHSQIVSLTISWKHIILLIGCIFLTWVINSAQTLTLLRMENIDIGFWENLLIQTMMILVNYLPMRIGTIIRFQYFKKVHQVEYFKFGGIIGLRLLILLFASLFVTLTALVGSENSNNYINHSLLYIFLASIFIIYFLFRIPLNAVSNSKKPVFNLFEKFLSAYMTIRKKPELAVFILILVLFQFFFLGLRLYICFDAMNIKTSIWNIMLIAPMATLASFLSITPGNLGIREWVIAGLSAASGLNFSSSVFAGSLDRAVLMACTFIFGSIGYIYVWLKLHRVR